MQQPKYLPSYWSADDQEIFENLLLPVKTEPSPGPHGDATASALSEILHCTSPTINLMVPSKRLELPTTAFQTSSEPMEMGSKRRTNEERLAKHREAQRRFIQRKKAARERAKRLAVELEKQVQLLELLSEKESLEKENARLLSQCNDMVVTYDQNQIDARLDAEMRQVESRYKLLDQDQYAVLIHESLRELDKITNDPNVTPSGFNAMGWTDRRWVDKDVVKFIVSKEYKYAHAIEVMNKTWATNFCPKTYAAVFNPALTIKLHILQRLNDDAVVACRLICNPQTGAISRSIDLFSRIRRADDYVIITRSLTGFVANSSGADAKPNTAVFTWLRFRPTAGEDESGCDFSYGGRLSKCVTGTSRYWLMEVFFMALRYEGMMFQPGLFSVTNGN